MVVQITGPNETLAAIRQRRQQIDAKKLELRKQFEESLAELQAEIEELNVTYNTVLRLSGFSAPTVAEIASASKNRSRNRSSTTVPEMILQAIDVLRGLNENATASTIYKWIVENYGHQDPNIVRPTMWRMQKQGRLIRDGAGLYSKPLTRLVPSHGTKTAADQQNEASSPSQED